MTVVDWSNAGHDFFLFALGAGVGVVSSWTWFSWLRKERAEADKDEKP